jgi:uncharacterized protein
MASPRALDRLRWRHLGLALLLLAVGFVLLVTSRAALYQWSLGHGKPRPLLGGALRAGIPGLKEVSFESERGVTIRGWSLAARNGAAVILTHGSDANREQLIPEARALANAGFGILAFDWPGQGESGGHAEWGRAERRALEAAVSFVENQHELGSERIGAFGFSLGGIFVAQVAAQDPRVRAVALASTPHDLDELRRWEHRRWGLLSQESGLLAAHLMYGEYQDLEPVRVIGRVSPRPLLVIGGGRDENVPPFMTDSLFAAAREPKAMFVVPRAGHGNFNEVDPTAYAERLRDFFERALL